jgi:hypothetical protein
MKAGVSVSKERKMAAAAIIEEIMKAAIMKEINNGKAENNEINENNESESVAKYGKAKIISWHRRK